MLTKVVAGHSPLMAVLPALRPSPQPPFLFSSSPPLLSVLTAFSGFRKQWVGLRHQPGEGGRVKNPEPGLDSDLGPCLQCSLAS